MRCCIVVAVAFVLAGCPVSGPPAPDRCQPGSTTGVASLAIGPGSDSSDEASGFFPYRDGSAAEYAQGGQGLTMLRMRLRVTGAGAPACLGQSTDVEVGGGYDGSDSVPRTTYLQPDGSRVTKNMFIVLEDSAFDPPPKKVTTTVGGSQVSVLLGGALDLAMPMPRDLGTHD